MRTDHSTLNDDFLSDDEPAPSPAEQHAFAADLQAAVAESIASSDAMRMRVMATRP